MDFLLELPSFYPVCWKLNGRNSPVPQCSIVGGDQLVV